MDSNDGGGEDRFAESLSFAVLCVLSSCCGFYRHAKAESETRENNRRMDASSACVGDAWDLSSKKVNGIEFLDHSLTKSKGQAGQGQMY